MKPVRYNVKTCDLESQEYTEQAGMLTPSLWVNWQGLLRALRELKRHGYGAYRFRDDTDAIKNGCIGAQGI